jgi:hypothetical protein
MDSFIVKHRDKIVGALSCFDRLIFKGHLPINHSRGCRDLLLRRGILFKDLKPFMIEQAERLKQHACAIAEQAGRPYRYLSGSVRKERLARAIADSDGIEEGLVCVLSTLEPCRTFRLAYGDGRPRLLSANRKCLHLYFYLIDKQFGFMHVRLQTWFPFTIQVYINGHEYLARKMDQHGLRYRQLENAFVWLENPKRAQRFADGLPKKKWPRILGRFARRVNPLLPGLLDGLSYYWVLDQSELATDIMFRDRAALKALYPRLLRHATLCFTAEDVLAFLGRKLHGKLEAEVLNDCKKRVQGARLKHRMRSNWIKMYDKQGLVLRIETVINKPDEFKIRRRVRRQGDWVTAWCPMRKGVANIHRYVEVSLAANRRYLDALSLVEDPSVALEHIHEITRPARQHDRRARALNPLASDDLDLFRVVLRGEHAISGFRNKDIRSHLFPWVRDPVLRRRQSAKVTRMLQRLHLHRLIAKVPRTRRWNITDRGRLLMSAALLIHDEGIPNLMARDAA